jgi:hypothetical protein
MGRLRMILLAVVLFSGRICAQKTIDFTTVDKKTYEYYLNKDWDSLISMGRTAVNNNIDYFYLRLRLATAYYYRQNYTKAIAECEKALSYNSSDETTLQLLYYSYLFLGRENDARMTACRMTEVSKKNLAIKTKGWKSIYFETGASLSNNFSKNEKINFKSNPDIFGGVILIGSVAYGHLGAEILTGKKFSFYIGGSFLNEEMKSIYDATLYQPDGRVITQRDTIVTKPFPPPPYDTYDTIIENREKFKTEALSYEKNSNLHQEEIYLNCNFHPSKGLDIMPFFHLLNTNLTMILPHGVAYVGTDSVQTHTQYHYPPDQFGHVVIADTVLYFDTSYTVYSDYKFRQKDTSFINYSLGLVLNRRFGNVATSIFGSYSSLNDLKQQEVGVSATWYPFGNLNLYFNLALTGYKEDSIRKPILDLLIGKKISKNIWLEGNITKGRLNNYTETGGFVVDNSPNVVKFRAGLSSTIILKKFDIVLHYLYQAKEGGFYFKDESGGKNSGRFDYQNQLITGGIKWKL